MDVLAETPSLRRYLAAMVLDELAIRLHPFILRVHRVVDNLTDEFAHLARAATLFAFPFEPFKLVLERKEVNGVFR